MSLFVWIGVSIAMVLVQGLILQGACTMADERPPSYPAALLAALSGSFFGGLATLLFRFSIGLVVGLLFSWTLAWAAGIALGFAVTTGVYRNRLQIPAGSALKVAFVHYFLSGLASALVWGVVSYF